MANKKAQSKELTLEDLIARPGEARLSRIADALERKIALTAKDRDWLIQTLRKLRENPEKVRTILGLDGRGRPKNDREQLEIAWCMIEEMERGESYDDAAKIVGQKVCLAPETVKKYHSKHKAAAQSLLVNLSVFQNLANDLAQQANQLGKLLAESLEEDGTY